MRLRRPDFRAAKFVPGVCLALALAPSFVSIALGRNASPITGDNESTAGITTPAITQIAVDNPRDGGGSRGGGIAGSRSAHSGASPQRGIPRGGIIPPSARTTPRAHIPARPEFETAKPSPGARINNFHGREFARLNPGELSSWRAGRWLHEEHAGYLGWWWVVDGDWYFYPEPIYPYPTYISGYLIPVPAPLAPQFLYYCDNPPGYYPDVQACYDPWQVIPTAPPPPLPPPAGAMANADVSAGFRIARDICSACHVIGPGQPGGTLLVHPGPAFQDVANRSSTTPESLNAFIQGTSWDMTTRPITMPRQGLSERSTAQVVSYILSLTNPVPN